MEELLKEAKEQYKSEFPFSIQATQSGYKLIVMIVLNQGIHFCSYNKNHFFILDLLPGTRFHYLLSPAHFDMSKLPLVMQLYET